MNKRTLKWFGLLAISTLIIVSGCNTKTRPGIDPPQAKKVTKEFNEHGNVRVDNYYWLNDREDPEVISYLEAENVYTETIMEHTIELQEKLYDEIVGRIKQTDESVPYKLRGYYYYTRYEEGQEYPIYCRKMGSMEASEEIMLNVNEMAEGFDFYQVTGINVSPDNRILAFGEDTVSRRKYTIRYKNLETGEILKHNIPNTTGQGAWANDNRTYFYSIKDESLRPFKIMKHKTDQDYSADSEVFHETDDTFTTFVYNSKSRDYVFVFSKSTLSTECRYLDANKPEGKFKIIQPRERDLEYSVEHFKDHFFVRTNLNAKNFRLMKTPINKTEKKYWSEVIPHRDNVLLESFEIFKNYLVMEERTTGLIQLRVINWKDNKDHYLDFGEPAYLAYLAYNPEFDTDWLRYGYTSLTTPNSTFDYNMESLERKLMKQTEVLGDFNKDNYQSERFFVTARNGAKVPVSMVYKKGMKKDGKNPLLLYAYGSYGYSMDAYFSSPRLSLLDRGFIFALAHVRGGQEMGRQWYEDGKLLKKKNTFTDFIDCAEYLVKEQYTSPDKMFAQGGSAGGLLVGAVYNMRPELFEGVIAQVPFVDVVTTMLDESIPLTTAEYDEWGNPNEKEYYDYMLSYSPYDQVKAKDYTNMLVTTGLHDSQVQYWEPAKWVAKLRELKTDDNLLLLHINMDTGHGGASGRFQRYKETALEYAFMFDLLGIEE
nr:S9 family peptidase [Bacteroidota bacterium]